jgi:mannose-6-phosphate isomerase-like protein (cupin superfamily)
MSGGVVLIKIKRIAGALIFLMALAVTLSAQSPATGDAQRAPSAPSRPFVVLNAQSLGDLEQKLKPDNKVEDLIGGEGMQLRVAVQHEKGKSDAAAELHDASDDVYYVLDGSATLILGGRLDAPREATPGEWRSPRIIGGRTIEIKRGDLVVVPRGTPHQRSTAGQDFTMLLIKVFAEPQRAPQAKPAAPAKGSKP